eukprot:TRINITY_DN29232_c0_g1_i1.p1 TRINITY_DN29232_c0_g1~~TRINITY_DN29232_c0_g1_i1.p1  ORF type:complete len:213 (-),score=45.71 TRINITY_DN29232_c0_g1_i1:38-676(-)
MKRRPPRSTLSSSSAASDVYKRQATYARIQAMRQRDLVASKKVAATAKQIMRAGDSMRKNSSLSVTEMDTFLGGTEHEEFRDWMMANRQFMFHKFDGDKDGGLTMPELKEAVAAYQQQHEYDPNAPWLGICDEAPPASTQSPAAKIREHMASQARLGNSIGDLSSSRLPHSDTMGYVDVPTVGPESPGRLFQATSSSPFTSKGPREQLLGWH